MFRKVLLLNITVIFIFMSLMVGCSKDSLEKELRPIEGGDNMDTNTKPDSSKDNDIQESLNEVDVVEYGAKDFIEPIECDINGTSVITAKGSIYNLSVGDTVRIINGTKVESKSIAGEDLIAKIIDIDGKKIVIDSTCNSTVTTKMYIDSTQAFKNAFNHANRNNYDILIPEGNYFVDRDINIQTNVRCKGKIYTSNKGLNSLFHITRKEHPIKINGYNIAGSLESGTNYIPELAKYVDYDVLFNSQERIMWRNNMPGDFYDKNETNRINNDGFLMAGLAESYEKKSLLSIRLYKKERPIKIEGLNILCIDDNSIINGKYIVVLNRSDVTLNNFTLENQNLSKEKGQNTGIGIVDAVDVTFNDCKIKGFMLNGLGYGILVNNTFNVTLNNVDVSKTRHAIAGRHDNYTIIDGGSYESYGGTIDSHWGHNCTVKNATVYGYNAFSYNGNNFTVINCTAVSDGHLLVYRREDCPTLKGTVKIKDTKVIYTGTSNFVFYRSFLTDFEHDAKLYNPDLIIMENVELVLKKDIGIVDICVIDNEIDKQYKMQGLPENIRVNNLYITGENDTKLKNTRFRMLATTSKYYTGNTNVSLENIRINRDTDSSGSLNYDGEIAYSFNPNHTKDEVPDTHYKMTIKDCGTLSINIVPTILGDMVIENCNITDYIYAGNLINDWPNNPIWWYKGTGKTIFKNVKFDRTGLPASTISIMNDAEFEGCEFINYGTIDYMDFGDELPTVQILRVKDCVFNEGGITGGTLSKFLPLIK